jgi:putative protease
MGSSQYVGDVVGYAADGWAEIEVKNKFSVGDRIELVHPRGNSVLIVEQMRKVGPDGTATDDTQVAPGSGHRVRIPLPQRLEGAFLARFA